MATEQEYAIALYDLDSKFRQVLSSSSDENCVTSLRRFKQFIDTNEVIKSIIVDLTKNKEAVDLSEFLFHPTTNMHFHIKEPQDTGVHILTMYKLIDEICSNRYVVSGLGRFLIPRASSNKIVDGIRNFLEQAFTPLFSYLQDELEKGKIMVQGTSNPSITVIHGNGNTVTYSGRDSFINVQTLKETEEDLKSLISKALQELVTATIDEDDKDILADDLDILNEEINSEEPKAIKFKRVKKSLDSFIGGADETLKKSISLFSTLVSITTKLGGLIQS